MKISYVVHKIVLLYHHFTCIYTYLINIKITIKYCKSIHIITKLLFYVSTINVLTAFLVEKFITGT